MKKAAEASKVRFVDLFTPTLHHFTMGKEPLTINGVHLNEQGHRMLGELIAKEFCGASAIDALGDLQPLRQAVSDKNGHWFHRYRATDGNDVWGSRSTLAFVDGQNNFEVLQHELVQLDVMTANRDQVVWAVAQGEARVPDDSNVPAPIEVKTNLDQPPKAGRG